MGRLRHTPILHIVLIALVALCSSSAAAVAAEPLPLLWQTPEDSVPGSAAGRMQAPQGIAADPDTGHIYVADWSNQRIDEFDSWGQFVRSFGWKVNASTPEEKLQVCTAVTGCQAGSVGVGAGQLSSPRGVAIDPSGDLYVSEANGAGSAGPGGEGARVQKFDPTAGPGEDEVEFIWAIGGDVNKTKTEAGGATEAERNLCTAISGDTCQMGSFGPGQGQFDIPVSGAGARSWESTVAISPSGELYVADRGGAGGIRGRIQVFDSGGGFKSQFLLPESGFAGAGGDPANVPGALVIDPRNGNLYFGFQPFRGVYPRQPFVYRLSPTGELLGKLQVEMPGGITVDHDGNVYVFELEHNAFVAPEQNPHSEASELLEFDPNGNQVAVIAKFKNPLQPQGVATNLIAPSSDTAGDVYLSAFGDGNFVSAYGPPPEFELPPKVAPQIGDQFAVSVDPEGALLRAKINPQFWKDTTYYVEYGTGKCSEGGCAAAQPSPPGSTLTSKLVRAPLTASTFLPGLEPGTTYHYRFVALSGGSEGQLVHGVGGKPGVDGEESSFTTPFLPTPPPSPETCPNAAFRSGASALLPDCRAYEMVSPVDKNNSDIVTMLAVGRFRARLDQSAASGDGFTFSANRAFAGSESGGWSSQYLSRRGAEGWTTEPISPPKSGEMLWGGDLSVELDTPFRAFSADLGSAWLVDQYAPNPDPTSPGGFSNIFRRDNATGAFEAQIRVVPPHSPPGHYPDLQGISADGTHAIFRIEDNLTPDAPELPEDKLKRRTQLYESYREGEGPPQLRLVSILPNGSPAEGGVSAGTANATAVVGFGRTDSVTHAISEDGSRIYWTAADDSPGRLYLRVNGTETLPVSESVGGSTDSARFWVASPDGLRALFSFTAGPKAGNLYEFNAAKGKSKLIASKAIGLAGASEDLSRFYFASEEALAEGAVAGKPNLFIYDEGTFAYIAELSAVDAKEGSYPSPIHKQPFYHAARASADGNALVFLSNSAELAKAVAGYDNTDQQNGKADAEVYRYDAQSGQLSCASCNPTGARPIGDTMAKTTGGGVLSAAATLTNSDSELHQLRYLSDDGAHLYFNSFEPLLPRDTNGAMDVYQWEAPGSGDCSEGSATFSQPNDGCLTLISSGDSPRDSEFLDASPSGRDVFFTTLSSLVEQDTGLVDVYDARAGGGFPAPPTPPAPCEGEACQGASPDRSEPTPASASYQGPGNVDEKPKGRCAKNKVRRKGRCVARKHKRAGRKANRKRRAAR